MTYTREAAEKIYRTHFGVNTNMTGQSALNSYRNMMNNIKINYSNDLDAKATKLNELIMPYFDDIKANPSKVL